MGANQNVTMLSLRIQKVFFFAIILILSFSCRKKGCMDPNATNFDSDAELADNTTCLYVDFERSEMLANICDNYIIPAYADFNEKTTILNVAATTFSSDPTDTKFQLLKDAWKIALLSWQQVSFIDFGPAEFIILKNQVNIYPTNVSLISENISLGVYDLGNSSNNDAKGFQALDYLLHMPGLNEQEQVAYFIGEDNALTYLVELTNDLKNNAQYVVNEWEVYKSTFRSNNGSNAVGSSVSNLVNGLCSYYETYIRKGKIGLPLGAFNQFTQEIDPTLVECYYHQESLPFISTALEGMKKYINGVSFNGNMNGLGLDDYMDYVGATQNSSSLSTVISDQIDLVLGSLGELNDPLSNELAVNESGVLDTYGTMQQLVPYMKVDMTSALGVLITYQDNDGD